MKGQESPQATEKPSTFVTPEVTEGVEGEDWEDAIDYLPEPLQKHWDLKLRLLIEAGKITNAVACQMIHGAIKQREKIVSGHTSSVDQGKSAEREGSDISRRLMDTQIEENKIGDGNVANVYQVTGAPEFCLKVVWNQDAYRAENNVSQESDFLEMLSDFTVAGVRTPKYVKFFSGLQMNAILMERIDGIGLDKIMAGEGEFPDNFSPDDFFGRLEKYLDALHERNIFHMDIFPRNIMVDKKTGLPIVIDFGKSERFAFSEEIGLKNFPTDRKGLLDVKKEVLGYLRTGVRKQLLAEINKRKKF